MGCRKLRYSESLPTLKVVSNNLNISEKSYAGVYRYGFQGQETDDEVKGEGNSYSWTQRAYDPRIARWTSVDGRDDMYPYLSPYVFTGNNPIAAYEINGDFFNFIAAGIGAVVGGVIGAAVEYGTQIYDNVKAGKSWGDALTDVDVRKIGASAAEGAITGTMAGFTGGASLVVTTAAGVGTSIVGGGVKRAINGEKVLDGKSMIVDGLSGALGGAAQKLFGGKVTDKVAGNLFTKKVGEFVIKKAPTIGRAIGKALGRQSEKIIDLPEVEIKVDKETGKTSVQEMEKVQGQIESSFEKSKEKKEDK